MAKSNAELFEILNQMVEILGAEETLQQIAQALSSKELEENLEYVSRMYDLDLI